MRDKLEYLEAKGHAEAQIVAKTVEQGIAELYRKLAGRLDRAQALAEWGEEALGDLHYARRAVEHDVSWGLDRG